MKTSISAKLALYIASGSAALLWTGVAHAECPTPEKRLAEILNISKTPDILVLAHRGYWGKYAGRPWLPENSLGSVEVANSSCMDGIELDVKMTKDGVPILMHDYNLGRTTTIYRILGEPKFDPATGRGSNPRVNEIYANGITALKLLTPDRQTISGFDVPRVAHVLDAWKVRGMKTPLIFDIKTADAVRAVDVLVQSRGIGGAKTMAAKVNATLYPDPAGFYADARHLGVIPIFQTNMLGNISVADSLSKWMRVAQTIEINVKQRNGLLSFQKQQALHAGKRVGIFHALPDSPVAGAFYKNTGNCCYKLSDIFYHHRVHGQPAGSDTEDHRGSLNFIVGEGFGLITTDDPKETVRILAKARKREHHYRDYPF